MSYNQPINQTGYIPKKQIMDTKRVISINDQHTDDEEKFIKTSVQKEIDMSIKRIREKEKQMLEEMETKREQIFQEFKEEAIKQAYERLQEENNEKKDEIKKILLDINQEKIDFYQYIEENTKEIVAENHKELYQIAFDMVKEIINEEIKISDEKMEKYLENALLNFSKKTKIISVRVHPTLVSYLRNKSEQHYMKNIVLFGDLDLEETDIVIETEQEFVNVGIQSKLNQMRRWIEKEGVDYES